jgi:co-chaperonin GroES (HSP10)
MSAIQATGKRCIIKPLDLVKESAGGIILKSTDATQLAEIVSVGKKVDEPLSVGDVIVVDWRTTVSIRDGLFVVDSRAVQAVVER